MRSLNRSLFFIIAGILCMAALSFQDAWAANRAAQWLIPGVTSINTAREVKAILEDIDGVLRVGVSYRYHKATVIFDDTRCTLEDISRALRNNSYPPQGGGDVIESFVPET
jgi:copper chaperone CopZ